MCGPDWLELASDVALHRYRENVHTLALQRATAGALPRTVAVREPFGPHSPVVTLDGHPVARLNSPMVDHDMVRLRAAQARAQAQYDRPWEAW